MKLSETYDIPWDFKTWISLFANVDLPIGDLAADICNDKDFPEGEDYFEILEYLSGKAGHNRQEIISLFRKVWDFYEWHI